MHSGAVRAGVSGPDGGGQATRRYLLLTHSSRWSCSSASVMNTTRTFCTPLTLDTLDTVTVPTPRRTIRCPGCSFRANSDWPVPAGFGALTLASAFTAPQFGHGIGDGSPDVVSMPLPSQ